MLSRHPALIQHVSPTDMTSRPAQKEPRMKSPLIVSSRSRFTTCAVVSLGVFTHAAVAQPCGDWSVTPNPVFEGTEFRPTLIVPFSPDSAVAINSAPAPGGAGLLRTLWDGSTWTSDTPGPLDLDNVWDARAVAGSSPNDLWVSGIVGVSNFQGAPFLAHYDGQGWDVTSVIPIDDPNPDAGDPRRSGEGSSLVVIAPDDVWVIGNGESPNGWSSSPVTFHWDGSTFVEFVPQIEPVYGRFNVTEAASAAASDAVWLVGYGRNSGTSFHSYIYQFDGTSWNPQLDWTPLPNQTIFQDQLHDVVAFARDDVWAVGKKLLLADNDTQIASMYLHWDGNGWTEVAGPDIGPITSAAGSGSDDIWASNAFGEFGGRLAHWDGTSWTEVNSAPIPDATHIGLTNLTSSASGDVWAVGYWGIYDGAGGWAAYEEIAEQFSLGCAGDMDGGGEVNLADFETLDACQAGPGVLVSPGCAPADLDGDGDCDFTDFSMFQRQFPH